MGSVFNPFKAGGIPLKLTTTSGKLGEHSKLLTIFLQLLETQDQDAAHEKGAAGAAPLRTGN
jgi:hypothetical protein